MKNEEEQGSKPEETQFLTRLPRDLYAKFCYLAAHGGYKTPQALIKVMVEEKIRAEFDGKRIMQ